VTVAVRYGEFAMTCHGEDSEPYTRTGYVRDYSFNYGLLTAVTRLIHQFCQGEIGIEEAQSRLDQVCRQLPRYPQWLILLAAGAAGAAAALLYGGDWLVVEDGSAASRSLPISAEPHVVHALVPTDNIIKVIAPPKIGIGAGNSN
jgi:uncharacterized membrane protein YjjP (DUF1212 family)